MLDKDQLLYAYRLMYSASVMAETYEKNRSVAKYVHSTSRGHEAVQLATGLQLQPQDWVSPYYRDESMLLAMGWSPYELMLQLLSKGADPFSGGRSYYSHPSSRRNDRPKIIHQSSATGMQAIPTTGVAQGLKYQSLVDGPWTDNDAANNPVVVCSLGDASVTEGEVSEAIQFAVLHGLPVIYLVQDNEWGISVSAKEGRAMNAFEYAAGFKGLHRLQVDGTDFLASYQAMHNVIDHVRQHRQPWLVHARVCLLNHHTSGVRKEFYRTEDDLALHAAADPLPKLKKEVLRSFPEKTLVQVEQEITTQIAAQFAEAIAAPDPDPQTVSDHVFVPTPVLEEKGQRKPDVGNRIMMVDAALFAIRELMEDHPQCLLYGQDVGMQLGGVFREAATLADRFGSHRVFNTAIQEAYIIGSTAGLSAVGLRPIVEVQFADYIYPGFNQLVTEISKSCYLSCGKFPVSTIIRVPIGAYGGGGPYHSGSVESTLLTIKGIKVAYPSNAADMKGLMKAAWHDPNPVVMLEHKGLYWSKVPGTDGAKTIEPDKDYILPFGKGAVVLAANEQQVEEGGTACIITYGMGVYWAIAAAQNFKGKIQIIDLRTLYPVDEALVFDTVKRHGKCLILTEEQQGNSFAEALAGRISKACFRHLDAPVEVLGALNLPAVPLNTGLEAAMLPNAAKVAERLEALLNE
ncbi:alpha-ketoacid dehydrogenase subunit alpha/beta [Pseudocnuella soli]|uniref:alpha-ketoacid dehydrogenase subunit alpha/beta n=1 Tax=Pseudocnuella soli TaxID=2502779 RepID=UPI0010469D93|nr:alpha-ketoacid dehydrogenase subunit alpha/beta [Pseudocnuella soli]